MANVKQKSEFTGLDGLENKKVAEQSGLGNGRNKMVPGTLVTRTHEKSCKTVLLNYLTI